MSIPCQTADNFRRLIGLQEKVPLQAESLFKYERSLPYKPILIIGN